MCHAPFLLCPIKRTTGKRGDQQATFYNGTFIKSFRPLHFCGQHDIRLLPRHVLLPRSVEERENGLRFGYSRNIRAAHHRSR